MKQDPSQNQADRSRRQRNIAVFVALLAFVLLVYAVSIVKMKMGG